MKVFTRSSVGEVNPERIIAIDPGVNTQGWASWIPGQKIKYGFVEEEYHPSEYALPQLLGVLRKSVANFYSKIPPEKAPPIKYVVEYPHLSGSFSLGLCLWMRELEDAMLRWDNYVHYIPNRIPEWFLKQRSVSGTETVNLAKRIYGIEGRLKVHAADALLFLLFSEWGGLVGSGQVNVEELSKIRKPQIEYVCADV